MFKEKFMLNGLDRFHCAFKLKNGSEISGNIAKHFIEKEPNNFYLVKSSDMIEFAKNREIYDLSKDATAYAKMKSLSTLFDLDNLSDATKLN